MYDVRYYINDYVIIFSIIYLVEDLCYYYFIIKIIYILDLGRDIKSVYLKYLI